MNKGLICPDECYAIRGAIYEVHNEMGSGFREEVYQQCLEREFDHRGIPFDAKKELRICYKGVPIEKTYIPDFFCYSKIIVEIKAVSELTKEHRAQLLNYLIPEADKVQDGASRELCIVPQGNCRAMGSVISFVEIRVRL